MKILLVRPPASFSSGTIAPSISLPVGLISIAAVLEHAGFVVTVYDAQVNIGSPVSSVGETMLMGDNWDVVAERISAAEADVVGISCGFSAQIPHAVHLADIVKKTRPGTIVIVGGPPASVTPSSFLWRDSPVDLVCIGEGEYTMLELANTVAAGNSYDLITGTAVWGDGSVYCNVARVPIGSLDDIPLPAYHLLRLEDYFQLYEAGYVDRPVTYLNGFNRAVSVVTSRGCPFNCVFCSIHLHMGKRWRGNSVHYVKQHLELLVQKYGVRHFHFEDDNISFNQERFVGIIDTLASLGVTWDTPNGVRVDTLTEPIIEKCKKSGCTYLVFGVESGVQRILDSVVDKCLDLETVINAASWCYKVGLDVMAFFVIGFPGETRADMLQTISFAMKLKKEFGVVPLLSVATPLPGTRLERICLDAGYTESALSPQMLARMTQGNFTMDGGTFRAHDVSEVRRVFFREYRRLFVITMASFFLKHPFAFVKFINLVFNAKDCKPLREKVHSIMQVKNATFGTPE